MTHRSASSRILVPVLGIGLVFFGSTEGAHAYAGLGPLVPMIGSGLVLFFVALITVFGVLAYPFQMLYRKFVKKAPATKTTKKTSSK